MRARENITLEQIKREFIQNKQRRTLDSELRRAGKVRSYFSSKKQYKSLVKLAALQKGK